MSHATRLSEHRVAPLLVLDSSHSVLTEVWDCPLWLWVEVLNWFFPVLLSLQLYSLHNTCRRFFHCYFVLALQIPFNSMSVSTPSCSCSCCFVLTVSLCHQLKVRLNFFSCFMLFFQPPRHWRSVQASRKSSMWKLTVYANPLRCAES